MSLTNLLEVEIEEKLNKISEMEPGTDEYKASVDSVSKLIDRLIEIEKADAAEIERKENRKEDAAKEDKRFMIDKALVVVGIVVPAILTVWGTKASFKFEKEGTVTTIMGRGFINKLLPKK